MLNDLSQNNQYLIKENKNIGLEIVENVSLWKNIESLFDKVTLKLILFVTKPVFKEKVIISILLTDKINMKKINNKWRGVNKSTNVLSFSNERKIVNNQKILLGDIAFSYETIFNEAKVREISFVNHFRHLFLHGTLHLMGYDHQCEIERNKMEKIEIETLSKLKIKNPYLINKNGKS